MNRSGGLLLLLGLLSACALRPPAPPPAPAAPTAIAAPAAATADEPPPAPATAPAEAPATLPELPRPGPFARLAAAAQTLPCPAAAAAPSPYRADYLGARLGALAPLVQLVLDGLDQAGLPAQLAWLPWLESGYRIDARAVGPYRGLWQFAPATGRHYGLNIGGGVDQRLDPQAATAAALRLLVEEFQRHADWRWAVAAFNAGGARMQRAAAAGDDDAILARLPAHTRGYLQRILGLSCWLAGDSPQAAALRGIGHDPAPRWPAGIGPPATTTRDCSESHLVRRGDSLWAIARRYRTSVARLRADNRLSADAILRPGQRLQLEAAPGCGQTSALPPNRTSPWVSLPANAP